MLLHNKGNHQKMIRLPMEWEKIYANQRSDTVLHGDFPGGAVVKNSPANAGDMGSIPGPGRSYMPWSN